MPRTVRARAADPAHTTPDAAPASVADPVPRTPRQRFEDIRGQIERFVKQGRVYAKILKKLTRLAVPDRNPDSLWVLRRLGEEVGRPLAALAPGAPEERDVVLRWLSRLVFDSPTVRHTGRVVLIERVVEIGVFRDLDDWPELTGAAALLLPAAGVALAPSLPTDDLPRLLGLARRVLSSDALAAPGPADAMLLGLLIPPDLCDRLLQSLGSPGADTSADTAPATTAHDPCKEVLETARWISALHHGADSVSAPPEGALWPQWLGLRAFRGPRRAWARRRGHDAGTTLPQALPTWLVPAERPGTASGLPLAYGAMVVEWTLAALLRWPNRERDCTNYPFELQEAVQPLLDSARRALDGTTGEHAQRGWLDSAAADLIGTPRGF